MGIRKQQSNQLTYAKTHNSNERRKSAPPEKNLKKVGGAKETDKQIYQL